MGTLKHVWFDVDNTLYKTSDELEGRIFNEMYNRVASHTKKPLEVVITTYNDLFKQLESHTATFERLGIPADEARAAYNQTNIADYVNYDAELLKLFYFLNRKKIPFSIYSNNYLRTVDAVISKLGLEKEQKTSFAFKISGELIPKSLDTSGFQRILDLSRIHAEDPQLSPTSVLFVGDRERIDILPAKVYGMMTARVLWSDKQNKDSAADYVLEDIYELKQVVEQFVQ